MRALQLIGLVLVLPLAGCLGGIRDTTSARSSTETLLLSTAVDFALDRLDASAWRGKRVWVDETHLVCIDQNYVVSALMARLSESGCLVVFEREQAEVVIEARSGALAIWDANYALGIPALPVGYSGIFAAIPQIGFDFDVQQGWTRIHLFAYARESGVYLGETMLWGAASEDLIRTVYPPLLDRLEEDLERLSGD